jgi:hypothetical protein
MTELALEDLMMQLDDRAAELLTAAGIYPVLDYGWDGEDTPSDQYVGLAMWTTDAPFKPAFAFWNRQTPPPLPSERDEIFHRAGEDFFGTMEFARNAVGATLYRFEHRKPDNILDDDERFWESRATATVWLNIASDRIRDYFVMARFGVTSKDYGKQHEKNGIYARPFRMHDPGETPHAKSAAHKLDPVAGKLGKLRRTRNEIVHSLASRQGHKAMVSLKNQREQAMNPTPVPRPSTEAFTRKSDWSRVVKKLSDKRLQEHQDAINVLKVWYMLLVEASALTFEFEYWKRIGK